MDKTLKIKRQEAVMKLKKRLYTELLELELKGLEKGITRKDLKPHVKTKSQLGMVFTPNGYHRHSVKTLKNFINLYKQLINDTPGVS